MGRKGRKEEREERKGRRRRNSKMREKEGRREGRDRKEEGKGRIEGRRGRNRTEHKLKWDRPFTDHFCWAQNRLQMHETMFNAQLVSFPGRLPLHFLNHIRDLLTAPSSSNVTYAVKKQSGRWPGNKATQV